MKKNISFKSKFGWISVIEEEGLITNISFAKKINAGKSTILNNFKKETNKFFLKKTKNIKAPYLFKGNSLQRKIWKEIKKIKYGKTKSYNEIALKFKTSPRYIGRVCGQNKLLLLIPCHRVIRKDGSMGGFSASGGINLKKKLLNFEKK
tara:strand:- start:63 stop:509 length:447 start_codon:yes stop_codon:yes gene_type:complete